MALSYDPVGNILYVPDGIEGVAITLQDIHDASQAMGWGVMSKNAANSFVCSAKIYVNGGWLESVGETLTWTIDAGSSASLLYIYNNGGLTVGVKETWDGVSWGIRGSTFLSGAPIANTNYIRLYGSKHILSNMVVGHAGGSGTSRLWLMCGGGTTEIHNGAFDGFRVEATAGPTSIYNSIVGKYNNGSASFGGVTTIDNVTFFASRSQYAVALHNGMIGQKLRNIVGYGDSIFRSWAQGEVTIVDAEYTFDNFLVLNQYASSVLREEFSWQPTFRLGSKTGPIIQNVDVKLDDGKGAALYETAGWGGSDAKTDASGQLDFATAGIGPVADTAELTYRTFTGTSETEDATFKDHVAYCMKPGLMALTHPLPMDRTRKNDVVVMQTLVGHDGGLLLYKEKEKLYKER